MTQSADKIKDFTGDSPVYEQVREQLRSKIIRMKHGERLPPERKLSQEFSVACGTVRRAMDDLTKEGFIIRQQGRGTFVARMASKEKKPAVATRAIAYVAPGIEIPYHVEILKGIESEVTRRGYQLWLRNAMLDSARERSILEELADEDILGILAYPLYGNVLDPHYRDTIQCLLRAGKKVVLLDQFIPNLDTRVAMVNKFKAGYMATEYLIMSGRQRICFVSTHGYDTSGDDSYRGFRQALFDYDIKYDPRLEINLPVANSAQPAHDVIYKLFAENPGICSGVACCCFSMTFGIYHALQELGLTMGGDILLVGNDNQQNPELAKLPHIFQPMQEVGRAGVELLFSAESEDVLKRHVLISPTLIV